MDNTQSFLISVGTAIGRDPITKNILFVGKTLINSSIKESVSNKEIKGGYMNKVQYIFDYDKKVEADIEDCSLKESFIALANGTEIMNELKDFYKEEKLVVTTGKLTLTETPVGKVVVEYGDEMLELTPTGKEVAVTYPNGVLVAVTYQYNTSVDTITIDGDHFGKIIDLTLSSKICNKNGVYKEMQINIPKYKIKGDVDISLKADDSSTTKLSGQAIDDGTGKYATIMIKKLDGTSATIQHLVLTDSEVSLAVAGTKTLECIGIRGGVYGNTPISNSDVTFVSSTPAKATVDASGLVTGVATGSTTIKATLKSDITKFDVVTILIA